MPSDDAQCLHNRVRKLRTRQDMTQAELAGRVGVTRQTIIAIEAGGYVPSLTLAFRISGALQRGLEDVFQYEAPND